MSAWVLKCSEPNIQAELAGHRFDYLARRMNWKALKDDTEHKSRRLGIEMVDLEQDKKGRSKWAEACCG